MTNVNNTVNTSATNETSATEKAVRVTVNSCLFTGHPEVLEGNDKLTKEQIDAHVEAAAPALANLLMGKGEEGYKMADKIWKAAVKLVPAMIKEAAEAEAKAQEEKAKQARIEQEAKAAADKIIAEQTETLIAGMAKVLEQSGMSVEVARKVAEQKFGQVSGNKEKYDRVTVEYRGETFEMPAKGNQPKKVKEALAETGLSVEKFIETYQVKAEA